MGRIRGFFIYIASLTCLHNAHISTVGAPMADNGGGSAINANFFDNFVDARKYLQQCGLPSRELFGDSSGPGSGIDHFSLGCAPLEQFKNPYAMCYMFAWKVDSICPMYRAEGLKDPELQRKIEDKYLEYTQRKNTPETFCEDLLKGFATSTSDVEQIAIAATNIKPTDVNTCILGCGMNLLPICQGYAFMIAEAGPYLEGLPGNEKYPPFVDRDAAGQDQSSRKTEATAHVDSETGNVEITVPKNDGAGSRDMDEGKVQEKGTEDSVNRNEARTEYRGDQEGNVPIYGKDTGVPLPVGGAPTDDKSLANLSFENKMGINSPVADPARQAQPPFSSDNQMNHAVAEGQKRPAAVPLSINVGQEYSALGATGVKVPPSQDTKLPVPFLHTDGEPKQPELNPELGPQFPKQDQIPAPVQSGLTENMPSPRQSTSRDGTGQNLNPNIAPASGGLGQASPILQVEPLANAGHDQRQEQDQEQDQDQDHGQDLDHGQDQDQDHGQSQVFNQGTNMDSPKLKQPEVASPSDGQSEDKSNHQPDDQHREEQPNLGQAGQSPIGDQLNPPEIQPAQEQDDIHEEPEGDVDKPQESEDLPGISAGSSNDYDDRSEEEKWLAIPGQEEEGEVEGGDTNAEKSLEVQQPPNAQNQPQEPQEQQEQQPENANVILLDDEDEQSSHFLAYSLTAIILILATYIMYHNKQKIIAIVVEGRNGKGKRRRGGKLYQKLDQNISEAMPSLQDQQA